MGAFYSISCVSRAPPSMRFRTELTYMVFLFFVTLSLGLVAMSDPNDFRRAMQTSSGFVANAALFAYYAAPLSTILEVARTKSAETLHPPLVIANGMTDHFSVL